MGVKCVLHGSFRKHFDLIKETHDLFTRVGIEVVAPTISAPIGKTDGFVHLETDLSRDPRLVELQYLQQVSKLGNFGFSYYINPKGKLGTSASYELGIDQLTNTRYIFMEPLKDHPAYVPQNSVWKPRDLADYILEMGKVPEPFFPQDERQIQRMLSDLILHGSIIAVGGIMVDYSSKRYRSGQEREVLLVRTHKWSGRFSIVGEKIKRGERLVDGLKRGVKEETGLDCAVEESICTFDEIKGSGYYRPEQHKVFTDNIVRVGSRIINLNEEAEDYLWVPPSIALRELEIEPNARITLETYTQRHLRLT
ncbi:MAG: NUDIX domain-containing protein [Candidatus Woesearchaeota archaeon]